ncbi:MAG: ribonuclease Z [Candidatus Marsarchaeota archaeon]|nr:ribonuclease Z [Candidatus Marsarchaeota archaeon]MCL5115072.1 ribonuclease Z [Candidatus Marsarchaeota archaeon]
MPAPIKITFLGTSGSTPTKDRSLPSVAVEYEGNAYLFDCGEGTQMQLIKYSISPNRIKAVFITHIHGDHVIGVAGLVRTMALNKRTAPLYIYVPHGEEDKIVQLLTFDRALIGYKIVVVPSKPGKLLEGKGFSIDAFKLRHSVPTLGFIFREGDRYRFNEARCKRLGLEGERHSEILKKGAVQIGKKKIKLNDVATKIAGRKIVYATDTRPIESTITAARGADLIIHEATYTEELKDFAKERLHSTAKEGARVAKMAGAKRLIIFHMSARYDKPDALLKEARGVFKKTDAAYDGMRITI